MKLIIHDFSISNEMECNPDDKIISAVDMIQRCRGCFNCWVRTPGQCIIQDGYESLGKDFSKSEEIVIISRCVYGSVSPQIKRVIDRSIGYAHPFFVFDKHEMHHKRRYPNHFNLTVCFYGTITQEEKQTAIHFAEMLKRKYAANSLQLEFFENEKEITL